MRKIILLLIIGLYANAINANNVVISGVSVNGKNISFTLSWENSWNSTNNVDPNYPSNWDAVWVFVKFQSGVDNLWKHAVLSATSADHSVTGAGGVLQADAVTDGMGVFVRRSAPGGGNIVSATVTLAMTSMPTGPLNFKVFGVEMVHCPTGDFEIGDSNNDLSYYFIQQTVNAARQANGFLVNELFNNSGALPNTFPMGYSGYYIMKYEVSHEQFADFLNSLTYDQQEGQFMMSPGSPAGTKVFDDQPQTIAPTTGTIEIINPGVNNTTPAVFGCDYTDDGVYNSTNDGQNIALAGVSNGEMFAYLDWSGLRPMTEMEYEKACRGNKPAVRNEYAWGSATINCYQRNNLMSQGESNESIALAPSSGSCMCPGTTDLLGIGGTSRTGIFATSFSGRSASGAGFYGAMDLTGNTIELCIHTSAVTFTGNHGNGNLNSNGQNDVPDWPTIPPYFVLKGGSWLYAPSSLHLFQTSYRLQGFRLYRQFAIGIRGVRSYQ